MHAAGAAAAAGGAGAAAAAGGGLWLAHYNRENFMFDSELRFQRFMMSRGFANSQVGQYREDVRGLTEMTSAKMDTLYTVATLFMCIAAALGCAGRIGMHGAAPPSYLCALYTGHIFTSILYLTLAMWLALHASLRAQCGMVSLLTRKVRLPIPSLSDLDQARNFGSAFEKQQWGDMVRVPFMAHPEAAPDAPEESSGDSEGELDTTALKKGSAVKKTGKDSKPTKDRKKGSQQKGHDVRGDFGSTRRDTVPSWIRDEQVLDKGAGIAGGKFSKDDHEAPEHFNLYANAQLEWIPYDVYARISLLFGVMQFLFAVTYYVIGTAISELRGFWIMWSVPLLFVCAQVLIFRLDTLRAHEAPQMLPHLEWAGHIAPFLAVAACTLDFRYTYSPAAIKICWAFVYACFLGHFLFAIRLLDIAWPSYYRKEDMPDLPGKGWWPASWKLPVSMQQSLWIIAPPKKLEPGQHDLINEMKALSQTGGGISEQSELRNRKKNSKKRTTPVPLKELRQQIARLDRHFDWWLKDDVYNKVPDRSKLDNMKFTLEDIRQQVRQLSDAHGSPMAQSLGKDAGRDKFDMDRRNIQVAEKIQEIEEGMQKLESTVKITSKEGSTKGGQGAYTHQSPFKSFGESRASDLPWQLTRWAIIATASCWLFMIFGTSVEIALGPENLLKPPGEPPWIRDQKLRRWNPSFIHLSTEPTPEGYKLFSPVEANYEFASAHEHLAHHMPILSHLEKDQQHASGHDSGDHRRLKSGGVAHNRSERIDLALYDLVKILPTLGWLANALDDQAANQNKNLAPILAAGDHAHRAPGFMAPPLQILRAAWPLFFEPQHLVCSPSSSKPMVAALTSRGFGAVLNVRGDGKAALGEPRTFALDGTIEFGPLVGVSWGQEGLWIVSKAGQILQCPGQEPDSESATWKCLTSTTTSPLPLPHDSKTLLAAAAISELAAGQRMAALLFADSRGRVELLEDDGQGWRPAGEIHVPLQSHARADIDSHIRLAFDGTDLLVVTSAGEVHRRSIVSSKMAVHAALVEPGSGDGREWRAACALPHASGSSHGALLRLSLRRSDAEAGAAWQPELIASV